MADTEVAVHQLNDIKAKQVIQNDKAQHQKKKAAVKVFEQRIEICRNTNNPDLCIKNLLKVKKRKMLLDVDNMSFLLDSLCINSHKYCLRNSRKTCRSFGSGECAGGKHFTETQECYKKCPNFSKLMKGDIMCRKKCADCKFEKDRCMEFYSDNKNRNFLCEQPCFPCIGCESEKHEQVNNCHKHCEKRVEKNRFENRCNKIKKEMDNLCMLCEKAPLCLSNKNCRECQQCRKKGRQINRCADQLALAIKKKMNTYCKANCITCKGKNQPCYKRCHKECIGKKAKKAAISQEVMKHHLVLGLAAKQTGNLKKLLVSIAKKIKNHQSIRTTMVRRKKRQTTQRDSDKSSMIKYQKRIIEINSKLKKLAEQKKKILSKLKREKVTGAKKATIKATDEKRSQFNGEIADLSNELRKLKIKAIDLASKLDEFEKVLGAIHKEVIQQNIQISAFQSQKNHIERLLSTKTGSGLQRVQAKNVVQK